MEPQIVTLSFTGVVPVRNVFFSGTFVYRSDAPPFIDAITSSTYRATAEVTIEGRVYTSSQAQLRVDNDQPDGGRPPTFSDGLAISANLTNVDNALDRVDFSLSFDAAPGLFTSERPPVEIALVDLEPVFGFVTAPAADLDFETAVAVALSTDGEPVEIVNELSLADVRTVALLYEAALDRDGAIDIAGLNFWIDQREAGLSTDGLARDFIESPEFEAAFGDPAGLSDVEFVEILYQNVLDRPGEQGGVDFWVGALAQPGFERTDVLVAFANSPENVAGAPIVDDLMETSPGFWEFV